MPFPFTLEFLNQPKAPPIHPSSIPPLSTLGRQGSAGAPVRWPAHRRASTPRQTFARTLTHGQFKLITSPRKQNQSAQRKRTMRGWQQKGWSRDAIPEPSCFERTVLIPKFLFCSISGIQTGYLQLWCLARDESLTRWFKAAIYSFTRIICDPSFHIAFCVWCKLAAALGWMRGNREMYECLRAEEILDLVADAEAVLKGFNPVLSSLTSWSNAWSLPVHICCRLELCIAWVESRTLDYRLQRFRIIVRVWDHDVKCCLRPAIIHNTM